MKQLLLLFIAIALLFLTGCGAKEEVDYIKTYLPEYLYEVDVRNAAGEEMHDLINELGYYAGKQEEEYKQSIMSIDSLLYTALTSILDTSPEEILDAYTDRYNEIALDNMGNAFDLACKEAISVGKHECGMSIPNESLFKKVLGTPIDNPSLSDIEIEELLKNQILCNMPEIRKRSVEKCKYQTEDHLWAVTMTDGLTVHVKVEKNNAGTKDYTPILPDGYINELQ